MNNESINDHNQWSNRKLYVTSHQPGSAMFQHARCQEWFQKALQSIYSWGQVMVSFIIWLLRSTGCCLLLLLPIHRCDWALKILSMSTSLSTPKSRPWYPLSPPCAPIALSAESFLLRLRFCGFWDSDGSSKIGWSAASAISPATRFCGSGTCFSDVRTTWSAAVASRETCFSMSEVFGPNGQNTKIGQLPKLNMLEVLTKSEYLLAQNYRQPQNNFETHMHVGPYPRAS